MLNTSFTITPHKYSESYYTNNTFWFTIANNSHCLVPAFRCKDFFQLIAACFFLKTHIPYKYLGFETPYDLYTANTIVMHHPNIFFTDHEPNIQHTIQYINKIFNTTVSYKIEKTTNTHVYFFLNDSNFLISKLNPVALSFFISLLRNSPFFNHHNISDFINSSPNLLKQHIFINQNDLKYLKITLPLLKDIENNKVPTDISRWNFTKTPAEYHSDSGIVSTHNKVSYYWDKTSPLYQTAVPVYTRMQFAPATTSKLLRHFSCCKAYCQDIAATWKDNNKPFYVITTQTKLHIYNERIHKFFSLIKKHIPHHINIKIHKNIAIYLIPPKILNKPYLLGTYLMFMRIAPYIYCKNNDILSLLNRCNILTEPNETNRIKKNINILKRILNNEHFDQTWTNLTCSPHSAGYEQLNQLLQSNIKTPLKKELSLTN